MTNFDPFGSNTKSSSPKDVKEFHVNDDVDSANKAHHHTLGDGIFQAASGQKLKQLVDQYGLDMSAIDIRFDNLEAADILLDGRLDTLELDTGWIDVSFLNGWTNFDTRTVQYRKVMNKLVFWRGVAKGGTVGGGTPICNVPVGFRPANRVYADLSFPTNSNNALGFLDVGGNGNVALSTGSNVYAFMNPIFYVTG